MKKFKEINTEESNIDSSVYSIREGKGVSSLYLRSDIYFTEKLCFISMFISMLIESKRLV